MRSKHYRYSTNQQVVIDADPRLVVVAARMRTWKFLRDCCLKSGGIHAAMLGIARLRGLALTG